MNIEITDRMPKGTELVLCGKESASSAGGAARRLCPPVRVGDGTLDEEALFGALKAAIGEAAADGRRRLALDGDSYIASEEERSYVRSVLFDCLSSVAEACGNKDLSVAVVYGAGEEKGELLDRLEGYLRRAQKVTVKQVYGDTGDPLMGKFEAFNARLGQGKNFRDLLQELLNERTFRKNSEIYRLCGISKITFSRIMNYRVTHRPSKETVGAIAVGLQLGLEKAQELYHSAGYHLGTTEFTDRVIRFFLEEGPCNINDINYCLDYYGFPLLGEHGRDDAIDL